MNKILKICNSVLKLLPYGLMNGVKRVICFTMYHISKDAKKKQLWLGRMEKFAFRSGKNVARLHRNIENVLTNVRQRVAKKHKATVWLVCYEVSQWTFQSIYDAMIRRPEFDVFVFLSRPWERDWDKEAVNHMAEFFESRGMKTVRDYNHLNKPDIIIFSIFEANKLSIDPVAVSKDAVCCYVPYFWSIVANSSEYFFKNDRLGYFTRAYMNDEIDVRTAMSGRCTYRKGVVCSGRPKNDECALRLAHRESIKCDVWKTKGLKRIIYAPHWSIGVCSNLGTFDIYCWKMLEYVRSHQDIEICLKPHPYLRARLQNPQGIANTLEVGSYYNDPAITGEEYEAFLREWEALPNASIMDSGGYADLFATSDAMILDSISFVAEYMVYDRPSCFVCKDSADKMIPRWNATGLDLMKANTLAYKWEDIESFLADVCNGIDRHAKERNEMIHKYLHCNWGHVGDFISDDLWQLMKG